MRHSNTVDDVIDFILANAPSEGEEAKKPFPARRFKYELVDSAVNELHAEGRFLDLEAYDIRGTLHMWHTKEGVTNYALARKATKNLIKTLQEKSPDKKLEEILPTIMAEHFLHAPSNRYQTILGGMMASVYESSPYDALKDLVNNDPKLAEFRDLQPYDMQKPPENTWNKKDGTKNYELARQATKQLVKELQKQNPDKELEQIFLTITARQFYHVPINRYRTTLGGMLANVYECSPYQALKDLAEHDDELRKYLPIIEELRHKAA